MYNNLNSENRSIVVMFKSTDMSVTVPNVPSGYKEKPFAVVAPFQRKALNLGISAENQHHLHNESLPTSPEGDCDEGPGVSCFLEHNTRELLGKFFFLVTSTPCGHERHDKVLETMKRVVDSLLEKHELVYKGMLVKLNLDQRGDDMTVVSSVAKELFTDGKTNWGRIASLLAFGAVVAQYEAGSGRGHCVNLVAEQISSHLLSTQKEWLLKNNAWDGFVEFFRVPDPESSVRSTLTTIATVAGIGAVLAYLTR